MQLSKAVEQWSGLRGLAEQVVAEANATLPSTAPRFELEDEPGRLAFSVRHGPQWVRIALNRSGADGWLETESSPGAGQLVERFYQGGICTSSDNW